MTNDTNDAPGPRGDSERRRAIPTTGAPRRGPVGFTTLAVSTRGGQLELDPHTAGARTITLDEDGTRVLRDALSEWLG